MPPRRCWMITGDQQIMLGPAFPDTSILRVLVSGRKSTVKLSLAKWSMAFVLALAGGTPALSDGMVGSVVNSPIFANGTVRDIRSGINIYLQRDDAPGLDFMDPKVVGYGIPPGGRLEVEMVGGFQRDPGIPLAQPSILLVAGTPQQALPGRTVGYTVSEGQNQKYIRHHSHYAEWHQGRRDSG